MKVFTKKITSFIILALLCNILLAQKNKDVRAINLISQFELQDLKFTQYDSSAKAKPIYTKMQDAKYNTPEELMDSYISTSGLEWDNQNRLPDKPYKGNRKYRKFSGGEIQKNYFQLLHKVEFVFDGTKIAYIKYAVVQDNKQLFYALTVLKQFNGRWYWDGVDTGFEKFSEIIWMIKTDFLMALIEGKQTEDKKINSNIDKTRGVEGELSLDKLYEMYIGWKENKDEQVKLYFDKFY